MDYFTKEYYKNFEIILLQKKLKDLFKKLSTLKSEKTRKIYYTEIYATYLQIIEIFCINTFAISENNLIDNIFLNNYKIQEKIESRFFEESHEDGRDYITFVLDTFVFAIKDEVKDRTQQKHDYKHMVKESIKDYLKDKNFLNSYKHGFRVYSGEKGSLHIGFTGSNQTNKISDYSSSISYYVKEDSEYYKKAIYFNWERVYVKSLILLNILSNMKKVYTSNDKEIDFEYVVFEDRQKVASKYGCFRTSVPIDKHDLS